MLHVCEYSTKNKISMSMSMFLSANQQTGIAFTKYKFYLV